MKGEAVRLIHAACCKEITVEELKQKITAFPPFLLHGICSFLYGKDPVHDLELLKLAIEKGGDFTEGGNPFEALCMGPALTPEILRFAVDHGANLNHKCTIGKIVTTAFCHIIWRIEFTYDDLKHSYDIVKCALELGADPTIPKGTPQDSILTVITGNLTVNKTVLALYGTPKTPSAPVGRLPTDLRHKIQGFLLCPVFHRAL